MALQGIGFRGILCDSLKFQQQQKQRQQKKHLGL
jgi:hypothetical protein